MKKQESVSNTWERKQVIEIVPVESKYWTYKTKTLNQIS